MTYFLLPWKANAYHTTHKLNKLRQSSWLSFTPYFTTYISLETLGKKRKKYLIGPLSLCVVSFKNQGCCLNFCFCRSEGEGKININWNVKVITCMPFGANAKETLRPGIQKLIIFPTTRKYLLTFSSRVHVFSFSFIKLIFASPFARTILLYENVFLKANITNYQKENLTLYLIVHIFTHSNS